MCGAKTAAQRPKAAKNLRGKTEKKFRAVDPEAMGRYREKLMKRAKRKVKQGKKRKAGPTAALLG